MNKVTSVKVKDSFINLSIVFLMIIGIESLLIGYIHKIRFIKYVSRYPSFISPNTLYLHRFLAINTGLILIFISYQLKKLKVDVDQPIFDINDRERVRELVKEYGQNAISYICIEDDKEYYFGQEVEGVIAYAPVAGVAVCVGDPICTDENLPSLLKEFIKYCKKNHLRICFCSTLEKNIELYTQFGFGKIKCGEEAIFDLDTYNLSGGKAAKIRNAINHANALGVTVEEYKPLINKNYRIEEKIMEISNLWLHNKGGSELSFLLGSVSLENPRDRKYFVAYDKEENMLGFIVFSPFACGQGYYADVTRRRKDAPIGVMEKITIEAFNKFREEGIRFGSLGLAPLVNVKEDGKISERLLELIYEKSNKFYGFKSLYHYKKKYGCTTWESRYFVYYPKILTPKIGYSIIKSQLPKGISDIFLEKIKKYSLQNKKIRNY